MEPGPCSSGLARWVGSKSSGKTWGRSGWKAKAGRGLRIRRGLKLPHGGPARLAWPRHSGPNSLSWAKANADTVYYTRRGSFKTSDMPPHFSLLAKSGADDLTGNLVWVAIEPLRIGNELPHNTSPNFEALFRGTGNRQGIAEGHNTAQNFGIFTKFEA